MEENRELETRTEEMPRKSGSAISMKEILFYVIAMISMTVVAVVVVTMIFKNDAVQTPMPISPLNIPETPETPVGSDLAPLEDDPVYNFDRISVNTKDVDAARVLSVMIHAVFRKGKEMEKSKLEKSASYKIRLRDKFIAILSSETAADLQNAEVKNELKEKLKEEINRIFGEDSVKEVYFSEYFIQ